MKKTLFSVILFIHFGGIRAAAPTSDLHPKRAYCDLCQKSFPSMKDFAAHNEGEHGRQIYRCQLCPTELARKVYFKQHMVNVHLTQGQCPHCTKIATASDELRRHLLEHKESHTFCQNCNHYLKSKEALDDHMHKIHPESHASKPLLINALKSKHSVAVGTLDLAQQDQQQLRDAQRAVPLEQQHQLTSTRTQCLLDNPLLSTETLASLTSPMIDKFPLHTAIQFNSITLVCNALKISDPNKADGSGTRPLHLAAIIDNPKITMLLIEEGANPNYPNNKNATPLHVAAQLGNFEVTKVLLAKGADFNIRNKAGSTPLDLAISMKNKDIEKILIEARANSNAGSANRNPQPTIQPQAHFLQPTIQPHSCDEHPLHAAVRSRNSTLVLEMLKRGSDPNAQDKDGQTPLHVAAFIDDSSIVKILLDNKANPNMQNKDGQTPLHLTAIIGGCDNASTLLKAGANPIIKDLNGDNPLILAITTGKREIERIIQEFMMGSKNLQMPLQTQTAATTLLAGSVVQSSFHSRASEGTVAPQPQSLHSQIQAQCMHEKPGMQQDFGRLIATQAPLIRVGSTEKLAPNLSAITQEQLLRAQFPLHAAVQSGQCANVQYVLNHHHNPDEEDSDGKTSLHWAVLMNKCDMVKILLEAKATVDAKDKDGTTPLYIAIIKNNFDITKILLAGGANPDAKDKTGKSLLRVAQDKGQASIAALIEQHLYSNHCPNKHQPAQPTTIAPQQTPSIRYYADPTFQIHHHRSAPDSTTLALLQPRHSQIHAQCMHQNTILRQGFARFLAAKDSLMRPANSDSPGSMTHATVKRLSHQLEGAASVDSASKKQKLDTCNTTLGSQIFQNSCSTASEENDNPYDELPLHTAALENDVDRIQVLLQKGLCPNTQDSNGKTPLHVAVYYGNFQATEALVKSGAKAYLKDSKDQSPLDIAQALGRHEIETLLQK